MTTIFSKQLSSHSSFKTALFSRKLIGKAALFCESIVRGQGVEEKQTWVLSVRKWGASEGSETSGLLRKYKIWEVFLNKSELESVLLKDSINHMASRLHMKYVLLSRL